MIKFGLKLWNENSGLFKEAVELLERKEVDFLELYLVPGSLKLEELGLLKSKVLAIHAPHDSHNFDLSDLDDLKKELFRNEIVKTADFLKARFIIVHAGLGDSEEVFKKNITEIYDSRILIENMPKIHLNGKICFGYSMTQLKFIKNCGFDICLDLGHALKSATSQKLDYRNFIESLINEINPFYFHISGGKISYEKDEHLDLFEGDFDFKWLKQVLSQVGQEKEIYITFEVPKKEGLKNDIKNIDYFKAKI